MRNPFVSMKEMVGQSLGKLPARLVLLLCLALAMASVAGLLANYAVRVRSSQPASILRLAPSSMTDGDEKLERHLLQGVWTHQDNDYAMSFIVSGDRYEWIILFADDKRLRYFSRGNIEIHNDILILKKNASLGYPLDPDRLYLQYVPITLDSLNLRMEVDKKYLLWQVPAGEFSHVGGPASVLFKGTGTQTFRWMRR